ncbi:MAG: hypothetical protein JWQ30_1738 [Sediminibacterium sp.]|nr:hypothetical protein [Sediminibacterium sp.]
MKKYNFKSALSLLLLSVVLTNCNKLDPYPTIVPPTQANFTNATGGTYYVKNDPNSTFKIPVGITSVSSASRNVTIGVTTSTGAAAGTQYTLPSTTVTIPAGKVVDSLSVKGLFGGYSGTRVDTLTFSITGGDVPVSDYNSTYKLVLRRYCDVISTSLSGNYANSRDYDLTIAGTPSATKYTATITNWTDLTATTASIKIQNLGNTPDIGFAPFAATDAAKTGLTATVDWTNPANFTVTIPSQPYVNSLYTYGASTISGTGTFSSCDQTFTLTYVVRVSVGSFTAVTTTLIK